MFELTHEHPDATQDHYRFGVELEFPAKPKNAAKYTKKGQPTDKCCVNERTLRHEYGGELTSELITVTGGRERGIEARTPGDGVDILTLTKWYRATIEEVESRFGVEFEPTGFYGEGTAGLHTHISPLTDEQADALFRMSKTPALQVFCGTSITDTESPVLRNGGSGKPCQLPAERTDAHNCCVNKHRKGGTGHFEWRLPEPMDPDHFRLLCKFLCKFVVSPDDAYQYARNLVNAGDERITAIRRANESPAFHRERTDFNNKAEQLLWKVTF